MSKKQPPASTISPEYLLLGFLNQAPTHGYDLHERIHRELGQIWHISLSQTYNILNRLEAEGYIKSEVQAQEKSPPRHYFQLTPLGHKRFEEWLNTPTKPSIHAIRVEFLTRLYFVYTTTPEAIHALIASQITQIQMDLAHIQIMYRELAADQVFNQLGLDLRIRQLTSVISWLEECYMRFAPSGPKK
ncbi:MAG: PadR family transcriptional regulator [Chloroflexota bacterium]|nr:PadR family transcriptional regulator [Chloroflexota bacterium]NOG62813.1 PadR family transcriptional regulator [Chloroflexota bacterium]GIK63470.1 MAG: PadR family transcriptional regulator [Chloroflexota bacterium]